MIRPHRFLYLAKEGTSDVEQQSVSLNSVLIQLFFPMPAHGCLLMIQNKCFIWNQIKCVFDLHFESLVLTVSQPPYRAYTHYPNFKVLQNTREKCHTSLKITSPHLDLTDAQTNRSTKCNLGVKAECETEDEKFSLFATWTLRKDSSGPTKNGETKNKEGGNLPPQALRDGALHRPLSHRWRSLGGSKESRRTQSWRSGPSVTCGSIQRQTRI